MCGIIGYTGKMEAVPVIIDGLKRLEYRGYDSAGVAFYSEGRIEVRRCKGKIKDLQSLVENDRATSHAAIGHTRWATHGRPSEENAHPHSSGGIVLVHNGIIENYLDLKKELLSEGVKFTSETDTEVLCHLVSKYSDGIALEEAVRKAIREVRGAYAIAVMRKDEPGKIVAVRKDSPLVVGISGEDFFVASDIPAFLSYSRDVVFLEDDEMAVLSPEGVTFCNIKGDTLDKPIVTITWDPSMAEKGGYKHFMLKEIFEQPRALGDTISGRINLETGEVNLAEFNLESELLSGIERVFIVACGTSWHASVAGKYMIEELSKVPVETDIASEFRYRNPLLKKSDLFISITQSGETADTLAAQRLAQKAGVKTLSICNVVGSTASREADSVFYTRSGPEIGVASTKAFTTQLAALYLFGIALGRAKAELSEDRSRELLLELIMVPEKVEEALFEEANIEKIARELHHKKAFLYLGRGINYSIALEGALKLKEISYIHAEAYPAGEMKHGPIALIDDGYPVVFIVPRDRLYEKLITNMQEIKSRGGSIITVINAPDENISEFVDHSIQVPYSDILVQPILFAIPLQLLAYHTGVLRGCDVDQPRNLAKSVTVE
jgi:glucosamine--fructose-6-phosphate aminotransferase (isomerizing)